VDGEPVKASKTVRAGQRLDFLPPAPAVPQIEKAAAEFELEILHEDEELLVINKPSALAVHGSDGRQGLTLVDVLLAKRPQIAGVGPSGREGLVHRLDKDTSGVLITAKTNKAFEFLQAAFAARKVDKYYLAFVHGSPPRSGLVNSTLSRHPVLRHKMKAGLAGGRESQTAFRVLKRFSSVGVSLVHLKLFTGRTHQARVHLASLGVPVLADALYGRNPKLILEARPELAPLLKRHFLHARRVSIDHPSGDRVTFRAPWPEDFLILFKTLLKIQNNR
jgi:23S rRNA pseudouridine1911/1915/1917 synthase